MLKRDRLSIVQDSLPIEVILLEVVYMNSKTGIPLAETQFRRTVKSFILSEERLCKAWNQINNTPHPYDEVPKAHCTIQGDECIALSSIPRKFADFQQGLKRKHFHQYVLSPEGQ